MWQAKLSSNPWVDTAIHLLKGFHTTATGSGQSPCQPLIHQNKAYSKTSYNYSTLSWTTCFLFHDAWGRKVIGLLLWTLRRNATCLPFKICQPCEHFVANVILQMAPARGSTLLSKKRKYSAAIADYCFDFSCNDDDFEELAKEF